MSMMQRYSEAYNATGGLAAEGVINQLGRPDMEPMEVLVREAVQNCWDAKQASGSIVRVEVGRQVFTGDRLDVLRRELLVDPPPGLALTKELRERVETLYFADFGTDGLGGPTRADEPGTRRDFVDFVRNIGQPPDKDLGGGSFGYGKAAFYIASRARTILIDTLCVTPEGVLERRFIGCALGENFDERGKPYTGRHWWGRLVDNVPEPLLDSEASWAADALGLPSRRQPSDLGTTIVIVAPGVAPDSADGSDSTMSFVAEALAWNFWPRMIDTPGAGRRSLEFSVLDDGVQVRLPNPRTHPRLRGFVEAMDRLRQEPGTDEEFLLDRSVDCLRPIQHLGRLVIQKGTASPVTLPQRAVPQGSRLTADSVHHVALMRNAELVVRYLPGVAPVVGRLGYAGVFRCAVDVDEVFRRSEPPTHDDWVFRSVPKGHQRTFVKVAIDRIAVASREAAGYDSAMQFASQGSNVPLGEFADAMAMLMPGSDGPGARRRASDPGSSSHRRRRTGPGARTAGDSSQGVWVDGESGGSARPENEKDRGAAGEQDPVPKAVRRAPQARSSQAPAPEIAPDGVPVMCFPFQLKAHGNSLRLSALIEVMANDGGQVEQDGPVGTKTPEIHSWVGPTGHVRTGREVHVDSEDADGTWVLKVELSDELMMRVDIIPVAV